ncbi:MAG: response regulator transcription factor [Candidatus Obscuribacterales bacterium]|nr:response regulator transcription factor [Candidatus Obscuribacterales bacterium]
MTLDGLAGWLNERPEFELTGKATNGPAAIKLASTLNPDVILLDLHLPDASPEDMLESLANQGCKIVVLSSESRQYFIELVLRSGVGAYLSKADDYDCIARTIVQVAGGKSGIVSPLLSKPARMRFSAAEKEVLKLIARGLKYEDMAVVRSTSVNTVRTQCVRLLTKLRLSTREQLISWAVQNGYGDSSDA